jgi:hypothetical protein
VSTAMSLQDIGAGVAPTLAGFYLTYEQYGLNTFAQ